MELIRDQNRITVAGGQSSVDATAVLPFKIDPVTGRLLTDTAVAGGGTVTTVSVVSANGLAGTVATPTTTPAITLSTTITGILKGNGTAISAGVASDVDSILPTQTGNSGKYLTTNGSVSSWGSPTGSGTVNAGTANQMAYYASSAAVVSGNANATIVNGALTLGVATSVLGTLVLSGSTSGSTTLTPAVAASGTLTLPSATDTLVGKATTDILTNKTYDTAGTGNSLSIAGVAVTANQGTGSVVRATSPTLTTPVLGVATATSINGLIITATTGTFTLTNAKTFAVTNTLTLSGTDSTVMTFPTTTATIARTDAAQTFTGVQTFSSAPVLSTGTVTVSGTTQTFPTTAQTLVGRTTTDTLTNKTLTAPAITTVAETGIGTADLLAANQNTVTVTSNAGSTNQSFMLQKFTNSSAATMTITLPVTTPTPKDGQFQEVRIYDFSAAAQTIAWVNTENSLVSAPTTSNGSTTSPLSVLFQFNNSTSKWRCIAVA